ncbi:hypothetical protein [Cohnella faecalis]|uniref:Uncharacterized protein n=1 Tax=Cohnella faecalis TaxID=2315694 RepID=A0A398CN90_9BACL|nr:hypothetical protein [Cohnella faecalis]RIE02709.1 hypothetical protein D3H35_18840 [Cohnella faecalis]
MAGQRITLLGALAVTFELTITSGGTSRTIDDFGDSFVVRSFPVGNGPVPDSIGADIRVLRQGRRGGARLCSGPLFQGPVGVYHAIVSRTGNSTYAAAIRKRSFLTWAAIGGAGRR